MKAKKKEESSFNREPLEGEHVVFKDASHLSVGGRTFKRTVLPSIAVQHHRQSNELAERIEAMIEVAGGVVASDVSNNTDVLIAGEDAGSKQASLNQTPAQLLLFLWQKAQATLVLITPTLIPATTAMD